MQLDSQVGIASTFISSRDAQESHPAMNSESLAKITDSIHLILAKLTVLTDQQSSKTQSVYVYNNMQNANKPEVLTKGTQTITVPPGTSAKPEESLFSENEETTAEEIVESVEDVLQCTICNKTLQSSAHLENHIESTHGAAGPSEKSAKPSTESCDFCDATLSSTEILQEHISKKHATDYLQCPECMLRFQNRDQLRNHVSTCHTQLPVTSKSLLAMQSSAASLTPSGLSAAVSRAPSSSSLRSSPTPLNL